MNPRAPFMHIVGLPCKRSEFGWWEERKSGWWEEEESLGGGRRRESLGGGRKLVVGAWEVRKLGG